MKAVARQPVILAQEPDHLLTRACRVVAGDVDLGSVAGRQHDGLGGRRPRGERLDGRAHVAAREVEPLSQVDRRRPVAHAEKDDMHFELRPLCFIGTCGSWSTK